MDFVSIDFETANQEPTSACSVGMVTVRAGKIVDRWYRLIRPRPFYFDPFNISIHGITEDLVVNEPEFSGIWPEMGTRLRGETVFAHYAAFDMKVLRAALDEFSLPHPTFAFGCSRNAAKAAHPDFLRYSLSAVAEQLGISFEHHNALADAEACALVVLDAAQVLGATSVEGLYASHLLGLGAVFPDGYLPSRYRSPHQRPSPTVDLSSVDPEHPFFGAQLVFTGALESMERTQAQQLVLNLGGHCAESVSRKTNFLVAGLQDLRSLRGQTKSGKLRKAEALKEAGQDIEIIAEVDFLRLVGGAPVPGQRNSVAERYRSSQDASAQDHSRPHLPTIIFEDERMIVTEEWSGVCQTISVQLKPRA